jgi:hypothetical protein
VKTYLIGYDLNRPAQNYEQLIERIKQLFSTWWHNLDSTWIVKSDLPALTICDDLKRYIDACASIFRAVSVLPSVHRVVQSVPKRELVMRAEADNPCDLECVESNRPL